MNTADVKRIIEAALLCAQQPMPVPEIRRLFADEVEVGADTVRALLEELRGEWRGRGVELVSLASGWRFQTAPDIARFVARLHPERPPRYSRAVLETLAIVAYRQPVTRGDIEEIRGVAVSAQIVKTLEDRGWIEVIGHKDVLGRPALFATTRQFLDDLGLRSLQELPSLDGDSPAEAMGQRIIALAEASGEAPPPQDDDGAESAARAGASAGAPPPADADRPGGPADDPPAAVGLPAPGGHDASEAPEASDPIPRPAPSRPDGDFQPEP